MQSNAIFLSMRITAVFLLSGFLHVSAFTHAQEKITLSEKNASLEKVFEDIQKQTSYNVWFDKKVLQKTTMVSIEIRDADVERVFEMICKGQPVEFSIVGKNIVIKEKMGKQNEEINGKIGVKGRVVDELGEPVTGASITVKGGRSVALTGADGSFTINEIDENATIVFSGANVETHEEKIKSRNEIAIVLKKRINKLDEVQIIGYGTTTRRFNTGSVATIRSEEIAKQPVSNPLEALEGRVTGLYIQQNTGTPGGSFTVRIRGQNSVRTSGNDPLFVIDGVPFSSSSQAILATSRAAIISNASPLNNINPSDIENIEVLRDADATAIYGSRGANGVILITTKKGKAGRTRMTIDGYTGVGKVSHMMKLLDNHQWLEMRHEAFKNDGVTPTAANARDFFDWDTTRNTNWQKELIGGTAHITNAQLSFSGGNSNTQFLFGGGYYKQSTVFPGDFADKKISGHFSLTNNSENNKFHAEFSASYLTDNDNLLNLDLTSQAITLSPVAPAVYDSSGKLNWQNSTWYNPFAYLKQTYQLKANNLVSNAMLSYLVLPDFKIKVSLGYTQLQTNEIQTNPKSSYYPDYVAYYTSTSLFGNSNISTWIVEPQAEYQKNIGKGKLTILAGTTFQQSIQKSETLLASGFVNDALLENIQAASDITVTSSNYAQYRYSALFGRINYNLKEKYIINLTGRRDGSSRFGPGKQFANFGAVGAAWIFSDENFLKNNAAILSYGKLRGSYGVTGNDQIPDYGYLDTYSPTQYPYLDNSGLVPSRLLNVNYSWETNKKLELTLDLGFLHNRILFSTSYYKNRSSDQLVGYPLPYITGFSSIQGNLPALVENTGLEFELTTINIKSKNLNWSTFINLTIPRNKLIAYPNLSTSSFANTYVVGQPLYIRKLFEFAGVEPQSGVYQFKDISHDQNTFNPGYPDDLGYSKKVTQNFYGGISNTVTYKNFQLDFFFQFVQQTGFNYLNSFLSFPGSQFQNQPTIVMNRWQKAGDNAPIQKFTQTGGPAFTGYQNQALSDNIVSDASFIRLKNICLTYQFPDKWKQKVHLQHCRIFIKGQNIFTITNYLGLDPETQNSRVLPPLQIFTIGASATF